MNESCVRAIHTFENVSCLIMMNLCWKLVFVSEIKKRSIHFCTALQFVHEQFNPSFVFTYIQHRFCSFVRFFYILFDYYFFHSIYLSSKSCVGLRKPEQNQSETHAKQNKKEFQKEKKKILHTIYFHNVISHTV